MSDYSYLNSLENTYDAAQEATGGKPPDGRYTAILNEAPPVPAGRKARLPPLFHQLGGNGGRVQGPVPVR
ncbi:MAG: hypothetical protein ACLUOB_04820 [Subdoligranulum sp.]